MDLQQFNNILVLELKQYSVFNKYWSEQLVNLINKPIKLEYVPSGPLGFYQKKYSVMLNPVATDLIINKTKADFTLLLTSNTSEISLDQITNFDTYKSESMVCAANMVIRILTLDDQMLIHMNKVLWSNDPMKVSGDSEYIKLIL